MANLETSETGNQRFARASSAGDRLRNASFPLTVRGYDRRAVDDFMDELQGLVAELESTQTRGAVVQRALDEVGEETAGILQRAHETADELTARSRAQADARLKRAEREAELVRRDADEYAQQVVVDTRLLWEERQRLIEDIRQLADTVLGIADDAMERVSLPEMLERGAVDAEPTTSEEEALPSPAPLEAVEPPAFGQAFEQQPPALDWGAAGDDPDRTKTYVLDTSNEDFFGEEQAPPGEEQSGGTVELEALPGGMADEEPVEEPERERED
jgi:cell division initiation protein